MNQLEIMQVFVRVAELSSFSRAADSLNLARASTSTAIQQLESLLGTRLLHRTTRRVQMTQDGQAFYERCKDMLDDMDELQTMFQQTPAALSGRLRVDMPNGIARNIILPRLPEFLEAHPKLDLELSSTDRRVDLVREGFDCVLRVGSLGDTNLIARKLGTLRIVNYASRAYLARHGTPQTLDDLSRHRIIRYASTLGTQPEGWEYPTANGYAQMEMQSVITVNNTDAYEAACIAGLGLIQAPAIGLQELVSEGMLEEILPDFPAEPMPVSLLYANRRHLPKRVQTFMDWVAGVLTPYLDA